MSSDHPEHVLCARHHECGALDRLLKGVGGQSQVLVVRGWPGAGKSALLEDVEHDATHVLARCDGGYTTNLPLEDLVDGRAWIAFAYDDEPLEPEHGGPARLLVPHLYFWKSAKWIRELRLMDRDEPGFWETYGYHMYGDPWREQRYSGD